MTHTVVPYVHPVVLCVVKRGGGRALVNMEPLKLYSSRALFGIDPHSGSVYPHSGCLCYEGMEGGLQDCTGHYRKKSERDVVALRDFLTSNCSTSIRVWTCTKCSWSDDRLPLGYLLPDFQQIWSNFKIEIFQLQMTFESQYTHTSVDTQKLLCLYFLI